MAVFQCNVISYVLVRTVDITVIVPSTTIPETMAAMEENGNPAAISHAVKEAYPVLYLMHGMGNNHAQWRGYTNIELFAEEHNIAVVMISGENRYYRNGPAKDRFFEFVSKEVPEFVTNYFPISAAPEHSYIAGLSMGGYGALLHGLTHPERYAAIGSFSGVMLPADTVNDSEREEKYANGPFDMIWLAKKVLKEGKKVPPLYIACGEDDSLYKSNVDFVTVLREQHADVTWVSVPGFAHVWRFWNRQVEEFLKWIPRTDGYAAGGLRQI